MDTITCTVIKVTRARNTASGNAAYIFVTDTGKMYKTAADTQASLALENDFEVSVVMQEEFKLTLDKDRKVTGWQRI